MTSPAAIAAALADLVAEEEKRAAGEPSRGIKAVAKAHHVPASTLREHWTRHRSAASRAPAPARAREAVPSPPAFDATAALPLDRLEHEHRRAEQCVVEAREAGQHSTAREWAALAGRIGVLLDEARQAAAADEARRKAAEVRDVVVLSAGVLRQLPVLARMAPDAAEEVYAELGRILGRTG